MAYNNKGKFDIGGDRFKNRFPNQYQQADQVIDLEGGKAIKTKPGQNEVVKGSVYIKAKKTWAPAVASSSMKLLTIYLVSKGGSWTPLASAGVQRPSDYDFESLVRFACYNEDLKFKVN